MSSQDNADATPLALLRPHAKLVLACFLGWFLDAFDQVALILVLPVVGQHFGVSLSMMGLVLAAQSIGRIAGNIGWGWLADRYGRKLTFMIGVIWFAAFSGMTGLAWSYAALMVIQFFFGIGFGGEWTASAALLMESVPERAKKVASSLMMAGYEFGFFAASAANALLVPHFGWRSLFFVGVVPAVLAIFIRRGIDESPVWLRDQERKSRETPADRRDTPRFRMDFAAWQACLFMAALQFQTASLYSFYPTLLKTVHGFGDTGVFYAVAIYSLGSIIGKLTIGQVATRIGERATIYGCLAITLLGIVPFAASAALPAVLATAFVVGGSSSGVFALVPAYLSPRFADAVRSFGMGLAYAVAAGCQAVAVYVVPRSADAGLGLPAAIEIFVAISSVGVAAAILRQPRHLPGTVEVGV